MQTTTTMFRIIRNSLRAALAAATLLGTMAAYPARAGAVGQPYLSLWLSAGEMPLSNEPYSWETTDGRVLNHGVTDRNGHAKVSRAAGVRDYVLDTTNLRLAYRVDNTCWAAPAVRFERCVKLTGRVDKVAQDREASERAKHDELAARKAKAVARYRDVAATNSDELAWLGPLPADWSDDALDAKQQALIKQINQDLNELKPADVDTSSFVCKTPKQFGPVPDQAAVLAYLTAGPSGATQPEIWGPLVDAARQGNWMARYQVYAALGRRDTDDLVSAYRRQQLAEWLEAHRVGTLYADFLNGLAASGFFDGRGPTDDSPIYVYAALHGSYSAMASVGRSLSHAEDSKTQTIGRRMVDCAKTTLPMLFRDQ